MSSPDEAPTPGDLAALLGDAVADAVATPLLLAAAGDPDLAWRTWCAIRDEVDRSVGDRVRHERSAQGVSLLDALGVSLATGVGDAAEMIEQALSQTTDPIERADAKRAAAKLGTWCGDTLRTASLTSEAATEIAGIDDTRAAALWLDAATTLAYAGHLRTGRAAASRARSVPAASPELSAAAAVVEGWSAALLGEPVTLPDADDALLGALGDDDVRLGVMLSGWLVWTGRHDEARHLLGRVEATAVATAPDTLPYVLGVVADLDTRSGWWRSAEESVTEAEVRSRHSGARNVRAMILVRGARLDAMRGSEDACQARLAEAERIAQQAGSPIVRLHAASIRSLLAVGGGDFEGAVTHGRRALGLAREIELALPGVDLFVMDLVEALVRTDGLVEAAALVDELESIAERLGHPLAGALAGRARLLVCDDDAVEATAARAREGHAQVHVPFEGARTNLILGERRRRMGARRAARVVLAEAHSEFVRLGAQPWAERAAAELRAAGGRMGADDRGHDPLAVLTPQEVRVARFVADGATNQETAAAMFLSIKSIERHLTAIYRKLGIRSRTELGRAFDRGRRVPGPPLVDGV